MQGSNINVATSPKTATFQMRINPEIKQEAENIFSAYGLSLTDAFNIFLQQSLKSKGFPFLLSPENAEYMRSKATAQLMAEIDKGWKSAEEGGWLTLEEVESQLGLTDA